MNNAPFARTVCLGGTPHYTARTHSRACLPATGRRRLGVSLLYNMPPLRVLPGLVAYTAFLDAKFRFGRGCVAVCYTTRWFVILRTPATQHTRRIVSVVTYENIAFWTIMAPLVYCPPVDIGRRWIGNLPNAPAPFSTMSGKPGRYGHACRAFYGRYLDGGLSTIPVPPCRDGRAYTPASVGRQRDFFATEPLCDIATSYLPPPHRPTLFDDPSHRVLYRHYRSRSTAAP